MGTAPNLTSDVTVSDADDLMATDNWTIPEIRTSDNLKKHESNDAGVAGTVEGFF